jgi:hypothetical protein
LNNFSCCHNPAKEGNNMDNHIQNNGITPPNEDKPFIFSEYSPDFHQQIFDALFPYHDKKSKDIGVTLTDDHALLLDAVMGQVELLRDLGVKISGNEDIAGYGLVGLADSLIRQLKVLNEVQSEFYAHFLRVGDHYEKALAQSNDTIRNQTLKIQELERDVAMLKGGLV